MVKLTMEDNSLILEVEGADKLWALKSRLEIPLAHVTGVRADPEAARKWWSGVKLPGARIPGVLKAGTFYQHGQRIFWDIHHPENGIIIELDHEKYKELVVEVLDPTTAVAQIQMAMSKYTQDDV